MLSQILFRGREFRGQPLARALAAVVATVAVGASLGVPSFSVAGPRKAQAHSAPAVEVAAPPAPPPVEAPPRDPFDEHCVVLTRGPNDAPEAPKRFALVIGERRYSATSTPLDNTLNDADDISAKLLKLGFRVTKCHDAPLDIIKHDKDNNTGFLDILAALKPHDAFVVYYAGHGVEAANGKIYAIPTDFASDKVEFLDDYALSMHTWIDRIKDKQAIPIILFDACRNNPFAVKSKRANQTQTISDALLLTASSSGDTTQDSDASGRSPRNSVFAAAVLSLLDEPDMRIDHFVTEVKKQVRRATNDAQHPRGEWDSLEEFAFNVTSPDRLAVTARPASDYTQTSQEKTAGTISAASASTVKATATAADVYVAGTPTGGKTGEDPTPVKPVELAAAPASPAASPAATAPQVDTATRSLTPAKPEAGKSDALKAQETAPAPPTAATSSAPTAKNGLTTADPIVVAFLTSGKLPPEPILEPVAEPKVPSTFCKIEDQNEMLSLNKAAQIKANDNYIKAKDYEALLTSLATQANQAGTALANQAGRRWDEYAPTMRQWKATSERLYTQDTIIRSSPVKPCSK